MKILICIPTYNERENISKLLGRLMNVREDIHVLVIDDNSPDGTGSIVEGYARENKRIHILRREEKSGLGSAYIAGFKWGLDRGYEVFIEMDADLSHRPRYLPVFLRAIEKNDIVIGSRWIRGGRIANWSFKRVLLSRLASLYARFILGIPIYDLTAGFVAYRRSVLEKLSLDTIRSDGYSFQIEMKYRARQLGFRLCEVPITFTDRKDGDSKISRKIVIEALLLVWILRFTQPASRASEPGVAGANRPLRDK